jgi:hypothetical protein
MSTQRRASPAATHRLGILSDLHALSRYALVPPRFRVKGGGPSSRFQGYLWDCWRDFCRRCPELDALVLNGDIIEGESPSPRDAKDALHEDPLMQVDAALEILEPLRLKTKHIWLVRGTPYHEGKFFETIERLGSELKTRKWSDDPPRYSGFVLERDFYGVKVRATHHMTVGAIYRGTLADRTALFATAAEALGKSSHFDVEVRSHVHMKYLGKSHGRWVVITPAFKLITPYAIKRMEVARAQLLSDIGGIVMTVQGAQIGFQEFDYAPYLADTSASLTA